MNPPSYIINLAPLKNLIDKIKNEGIEKQYTSFRIPKRGGRGFRTIQAPSEELKYLQRWILRILEANENRYTNRAVTGFAPKTSIVYNARRQKKVEPFPHKPSKIAQNYGDIKYYSSKANHNATVKVDLAKAFDSIGMTMIKANWPILLTISDADMRDLLDICTLNGTLPQGAPTSPTLLNIVLHKFDRDCIKSINGLWYYNTIDRQDHTTRPSYTRYADDITISFNSKDIFWEHIVKRIREICTKYGLTLKENKTRYMTQAHGRFITGINIVNKDHICVPRKQRQKIRAAIHEASLETDSSIRSKLIERVKGRISYVFSVDPIQGYTLWTYGISKGIIKEQDSLCNMKAIDIVRLIEEKNNRTQVLTKK